MSEELNPTTRELALQVHEEAMRFAQGTGVRAVMCYGGRRITTQITQLERPHQIVAGTPGRLLDLYRRGHLKLGRITLLILDEADRMLDLGFRDEVEAILDARLPRLVPRERLIVQAASQITESYDWWPLAERLAARLGEPLLAPGVKRSSRRPPSAPSRPKPTGPPDDQLALDLGG